MAKNRNFRGVLAGLPLALALALTGCTGQNVAEPVAPAPAPEVTPVTPEVDPAPPAEPETPVEDPASDSGTRWPLTGVSTDVVAERPALLVKVENSAAARPQAGLEAADIVYEQVVEGGMTRFVAVYHSTLPDQILPVRSARPTDVPIVTPYQGVFAYSGAQGPFIQAINAAGNQSLIFDSGARGMARVAGRSAPHNVGADPEVLLSQANATRVSPPPTGMQFANSLETSSAYAGQPVSDISARMSAAFTANYRWDAGRGAFLRFDGSNPSMSAAGTQLGATNVVLIAADMTMSNIAGASQVPETILSGSGRAIFAAGGNYIEGTWQKGSNADPFTFFDSNGNPVQFAPGNTWIQLVPNGSGGWTLS